MKEPGHAGRATRIERLVRNLLADNPRTGRNPTYTAMQYARILELALTLPKDSARPISEWSARELTDEIHRRGVCPGISPRQVARFLAEAQLQPHRSQYWINPKIDDPAEHDRLVAQVCALYEQAPQLAEGGAHVVSIDEKTGIPNASPKTCPCSPAGRADLSTNMSATARCV